MNNKLLPIGTVVTLKGIEKNLMITGFCQQDLENGNKYDYCGCLYPEGYLESSKHFLFNQNDIEKILFEGYKNEEEIKFKEEVAKVLNEENIEQLNL